MCPFYERGRLNLFVLKKATKLLITLRTSFHISILLLNQQAQHVFILFAVPPHQKSTVVAIPVYPSNPLPHLSLSLIFSCILLFGRYEFPHHPISFSIPLPLYLFMTVSHNFLQYCLQLFLHDLYSSFFTFTTASKFSFLELFSSSFCPPHPPHVFIHQNFYSRFSANSGHTEWLGVGEKGEREGIT